MRFPPPDSPLPPLSLFWQGHPDSLHSVAPLGKLLPTHFWPSSPFANCTQDVPVVMYLQTPLNFLYQVILKDFFIFQLGCRFQLKRGCYIWQMLRNATVTIPTIPTIPTAGRALSMDWLSFAALQSLHGVAQQWRHTLRKHRKRARTGTQRRIWNTSFTLRKSGKSQLAVEPKETQPRLIWHQNLEHSDETFCFYTKLVLSLIGAKTTDIMAMRLLQSYPCLNTYQSR